MFSLIQTYRRGHNLGKIPYDEYKWGDKPLWMILDGGVRGEAGVKRVDTKRFIRFEHIRVIDKKKGYWYSRTSHWFIRFPYCRNDKEIFSANVAFWFIVFPLVLNLFARLLSLVATI